MPRLCLLDASIISVNTRDHVPPHFHARYSGDEVRVKLEDLTVMTVHLSPAKHDCCWSEQRPTRPNSCETDT